MKLADQRFDYVYLYIHHSEAPVASMEAALSYLGSWLKAESKLRDLKLGFSGTVWKQGFPLIAVIMDSDDTKLYHALNGLVEAFKAEKLEQVLSLGYLDRTKLCIRDFFPVKPLMPIVECFPPHLLPKT